MVEQSEVEKKAEQRQKRLAAALRENLKRRKAQARGRRACASSNGDEQIV